MLSLLSFAISAPAAWTAQPPPVGLQIHYDPPAVRVHLTEPMTLSAILEEFCRQTQVRCDLALEGTSVVVPPRTVRGRWEEVVSELLRGTKLNYVALAPGSKTEGALLVEAPSAAIKETQHSRLPTKVGKVRGKRHAQQPSRLLSSVPKRLSDLNRVQGKEGVSSTNEFLFTPSKGTGHTSTYNGKIMNKLLSSRKRSENREPIGAILPTDFAPTLGPGIRVLPFLDSNGNPIPASNQRPTASPFLDSNGNPIPVSNQLPTAMPFPDSKGNPIPTTAVPTGGRVGSPFPPSSPP